MTCIDYFYLLLARREYSTRELEKKGKEKGFEEGEIVEAINHLQELGYQSDARLVESLISSSQGKYGKSMIKRKCFEKGISSELFEEVWLAQEEHEETDDLADLKAKIMRKYHITNFGNIDPKTKSKLVNYLQYRGFNAWQTLAQWQKEEDE
jgi:regulatory protein